MLIGISQINCLFYCYICLVLKNDHFPFHVIPHVFTNLPRTVTYKGIHHWNNSFPNENRDCFPPGDVLLGEWFRSSAEWLLDGLRHSFVLKAPFISCSFAMLCLLPFSRNVSIFVSRLEFTWSLLYRFISMVCCECVCSYTLANQ